MTLEVTGVLQVGTDGSGWLRSAANDFEAAQGDPKVPRDLIAQAGLETGVEIRATARSAPRPNQSPLVASIEGVQGGEPAAWAGRTPFKNLVAEDPTERIRLETEPDEISTRVVDLIAPIGMGQRCLIVPPPKAGKTVLLQKLARAITTNHPEIHLIVLLINERRRRSPTCGGTSAGR